MIGNNDLVRRKVALRDRLQLQMIVTVRPYHG